MAVMTINGISREVAVERTPEGGFVVTVDGRRHVVTDVRADARTVAFLLGSRSCRAFVVRTGSDLLLALDARPYALTREVADVDRPASALGSGAGGLLEAPMPGAIIAVNVHTGDRVRAGQSVIVLESMKMHNEITSPMDGVVGRINCKVGDQVPYGHVLAEIGAG